MNVLTEMDNNPRLIKNRRAAAYGAEGRKEFLTFYLFYFTSELVGDEKELILVFFIFFLPSKELF